MATPNRSWYITFTRNDKPGIAKVTLPLVCEGRILDNTAEGAMLYVQAALSEGKGYSEIIVWGQELVKI